MKQKLMFKVKRGSSSFSSLVWISFFISMIKSSNPRSSIVSLYPLSALQDGQDLVSASGPLNHTLMHCSYPKIVSQHLTSLEVHSLFGTVYNFLRGDLQKEIPIPNRIYKINATNAKYYPAIHTLCGRRSSPSLVTRTK